MLDGLIMFLLFATSLFLILLVLVQRGRGGGLAGAFGGLGGQSAFGTKAGDLFTRITIFVAAFWIILSAASVKYFSESGDTVIGAGLGKNAASKATESIPRDATGKSAPAKSAAPGATGGKAATETAPPVDSKPAADAAPAAETAPAADATPAETEKSK